MTKDYIICIFKNVDWDDNIVYKKRDILESLFRSLYYAETILEFEEYENEKIEHWTNLEIGEHIQQRFCYTFEHIFNNLILYNIFKKIGRNKYMFKNFN